ncbi:hypothetical protein [Streptomyces sp. NBC_00286]|uniref:hypothetical protein n=1 Tax=Streptomyces sp. NBC_00286 TaxID=2975701 RepID=UPI002E2C65F1|nr:hypothetical protein [Streptomyces sp. NBC_00286]
MTGDPDTVIAVWVELTGCGTRHETLTADGQVHVDGRPSGRAVVPGRRRPRLQPDLLVPAHPHAVLYGVRRLRRLRGDGEEFPRPVR